jgi:hypothetical protein
MGKRHRRRGRRVGKSRWLKVKDLSRCAPVLLCTILLSCPRVLNPPVSPSGSRPLVDKRKTVALDGETYPVRQTAKSRLKQIDFRFEDRQLRGLEQNPNTKSRWAKLARKNKQVMQFLEGGRYIAVIADGKTYIYKSAV